MARDVIFFSTKGIKDFERRLDEFPEKTNQAARLAVNDTADWARTQASLKMRSQINFQPNYLDSKANGKLKVRKRASGRDLEAIIEGRRNPTSLARFLLKKPSFVMGQRGKGMRQKLQVRVKQGRTTQLDTAFAMKLRAGNADLATQFNVGIALRVPKGTVLSKTRGAKKLNPSERKDGTERQIKTDLYLLYAPSVDQVFQTVAADLQTPAADKLEQEFLRQFNRLTGA